MKIKLVRRKGVTSVVVNESSYFLSGKGTLKGRVYHYPEKKK